MRPPRRRRGRRPVGRPQGRPARVPPDLLQARPRRPAAREVRRHRLRDDDRPRRARRPAHRQDLRGQPAPPRRPAQGRRRPGLRRDRPRRPADGPHRPVPLGQLRGGRPRRVGPIASQADLDHPAARSRTRPSSTSSPCSRRCRCRRPSSRSTSCATRACTRAPSSSTWCASRSSTTSRSTRRARAACTRRRSAPSSPRPVSARHAELVDGLLEEARDHAERIDLEREQLALLEATGPADRPAARAADRRRLRLGARARRPARAALRPSSSADRAGGTA